jgi:catecholate siderophore receptor
MSELGLGFEGRARDGLGMRDSHARCAPASHSWFLEGCSAFGGLRRFWRAGLRDAGTRANRGSDGAAAGGIATSADRDHCSLSETPRRHYAQRQHSQSERRPEPASAPKAFAQSQDARTGTVGVYANSTSVATKTNTALLNIPQSLSVITRDFIRDQSFQGLTDVTRYVPGVAVHQGEGNRDELVIRGVDSSANFFVNGFRDDVQYFRDLYNAQSVEVLKGPSALTFGRGAGGGLLNRTLKEADGTRIYDASMQTGSWNDRRFTLDAGQAVNENVAVRVNAFYEETDTFRDFGRIERYGINPTVTLKPDDNTKIKLSYEYFHDERTSDRGNPSQTPAGGATRFNPATPFAPNGNLSAFFGSPTLNVARAEVQTTMAIVEHDFENGLTVKNGTIFADYKKFYQNVYPGNGPLAGAVDPTDATVNLAAYQHTTNRDNLFNQTDFTYKTNTGPANPFAPTYFGPVTFIHQFPGAFSPGVTAADNNSRYRLNIESGYVRDTIEFTRAVQLIMGSASTASAWRLST